MANPVVNNVDGTNAGPNVTVLPDTIQLSTGNIWKTGLFSLTLSPASVAANTTAEQLFSATGIGLLPGDFVSINKPASQAGLGIGGFRATATADQLAITFVNDTASPIVPTASEVYLVYVVRPQPLWTVPASGNQLDW
jgi:hypothetical protein